MDPPSHAAVQTIHFIDFEGSHAVGVVEFGVVTLVRAPDAPWHIQGLHTSLCRPEREIPAVESAVHGIESAAVWGMPAFTEFYASFIRWRRSGVLAAHHHGVEQGLLKRTWAFPPFVPDWHRPGRQTANWGPWLDTLRLAQRVWPNQASYQLGDLIRALGAEGEAGADRLPPRVEDRLEGAPEANLFG